MEYEGLDVFCFKAIMAAIERVNEGAGDPDTILRIIDRVVGMVETGRITRTQFNVIQNALQIDITIPTEPEQSDITIPTEPDDV